MPKRFNNLDAALKYLRSTSADSDDIAPDAPAGTQLRRYQDFKSGKIKVEYAREGTSNQIALDPVALLPFSNPASSTDKFIVQMSRRSKNNVGAAGVTLDLLNVSETLTDAEKIYGFTPARVTIRNISGTATTSKDSKITGAPYKVKGDAASYTFPFGSQATAGSYSEIRGAIIAAISDDGNRSASFKPESVR
jgi:hypothetical protein